MKVQHEKLTPQQARQQRQGGEYLAPGIWVDRHGGLHFSLPEILAFFQVEDTPENQDRLKGLMREVFGRECPDATLVEQDETTDG